MPRLSCPDLLISKTTPPTIDLTRDSSSEDGDKKKYSEPLIDIIDHFDEETGEEALDLQIKDSTTLSLKRAEEIQRTSRNRLKATDSALDAITEPRVVMSSISSHATTSKKLMKSMNHIDDEILRKLIGRAAGTHADIVNYLRQEKSQENNVEMITPPGSPRPSTSTAAPSTPSQKNPRRKVKANEKEQN